MEYQLLRDLRVNEWDYFQRRGLQLFSDTNVFLSEGNLIYFDILTPELDLICG